MAHRWASLVQGDQIRGLMNAPVGQGSSGSGHWPLTPKVFCPVMTTPLMCFIV